MSCRLEVQLTYAENPNYFYFRIQSEEFAIQIRQIEHEMRRYVHQKNEHRMLGPTIGSVSFFLRSAHSDYGIKYRIGVERNFAGLILILRFTKQQVLFS